MSDFVSAKRTKLTLIRPHSLSRFYEHNIL
jgi:hypothetical protein